MIPYYIILYYIILYYIILDYLISLYYTSFYYYIIIVYSSMLYWIVILTYITILTILYPPRRSKYVGQWQSDLKHGEAVEDPITYIYIYMYKHEYVYLSVSLSLSVLSMCIRVSMYTHIEITHAWPIYVTPMEKHGEAVEDRGSNTK